MRSIKQLAVKMGCGSVGTLALLDDRIVTFEYSAEWLSDGFSISPFSLPLEKKVFIPKYDSFKGVFGIFADSLPDGWGRLLLDRYLAQQRIDPAIVSEITRLAIVGDSGLGALRYEPSLNLDTPLPPFTLDELAQDALGILRNDETTNLDVLFELGGSSGGARPKIMLDIDGEDWIIKFSSHLDAPNIGEQEFAYSQCARACGIAMSATRLFPSKRHAGYFGTKRFDRVRGADGSTKRIHMASVSALLETSHRYPTLDYRTLMKLTLELTRDFEQVKQMYRLMCFNVFAHNRDDHAKNFSFLYEDNRWNLSPAYDLTYSVSVGGEHATTIDGNGKDPDREDLLAVAQSIGLSRRWSDVVASEIEGIVDAMLGQRKLG